MPIARVQLPDGRIARIQVPDGTTPQQAEVMARQAVPQPQPQPQPRPQAASGAPAPRPYWANTAQGQFLLGVEKPLDNATSWLMHTAPGQWLNRLGTSLGFADANQEVARNNAMRANSPHPFAQAAGNVVGTAPVTMIPGGAAVQGAAAGALLSNADSPTGVAYDAAKGAIAGKAGQMFGEKVIAPAARAVANTPVGRRIGQAVGSLFGGSDVPAMALTPADNSAVPVIGPALARNAQKIGANLDQAAQYGLPYVLADASPQLRALAGSATRKSPDAFAAAREFLDPRSYGQSERLTDAVNSYLAPVTDIKAYGDGLMDTASDAVKPLYAAANARPGVTDPQISDMLQTAAAKPALASAMRIASNEQIPANRVGFSIADDGTLSVQPAPSFETLHLVKRGLDSQLTPYRDPFGNLQLAGNPEAQSVAGLVGRFNQRLKDISPEYQQANEIWAGYANRKDALDRGYDLFSQSVPSSDYFRALEQDTAKGALNEFQLGTAKKMADLGAKTQIPGNPYAAVYGSPAKIAKVNAVFPQGAPDFANINRLEGDMRDTASEVLGNSRTASRLASDALFDAGTTNLPDIAIAAATHNPMSAGRMAMQGLADTWRMGMSQSKADAVAPILFNDDPTQASNYIKAILAAYARQRAIGAATAIPAAVATSGGS